MELSSPPNQALATSIPQTEARCKDLADAFVLQMLDAVDISLPRWALRIEDLVSIEDKLHFVSTILPGALERVAPEGASVEAQAWLEGSLGHHGAKAHLLYTHAVTAYVDKNRPANGEALIALFS